MRSSRRSRFDLTALECLSLGASAAFPASAALWDSTSWLLFSVIADGYVVAVYYNIWLGRCQVGRTEGRVSVWGRVTGCVPHRVEGAAHGSRADRDQALDAKALPAHSWAAEACFELLAAAFNHAAADHILTLVQFLILHTALVCLQVGCFLAQVSCDRFWPMSDDDYNYPSMTIRNAH